jgi:hypothetical protein
MQESDTRFIFANKKKSGKSENSSEITKLKNLERKFSSSPIEDFIG